jgi:ankyrin repeat protein
MPPSKKTLRDTFLAGDVAGVRHLFESSTVPASEIIPCARDAVKANQRNMAQLLLPHIVHYDTTMAQLLNHAASANQARMLFLIIRLKRFNEKAMQSAIRSAVRHDHQKCLDVLLIQGEREHRVMAFEAAAAEDRLDILKIQMDHLKLTPTERQKALTEACLHQSVDVVDLLAQNTADAKQVAEDLEKSGDPNSTNLEARVLMNSLSTAHQLNTDTPSSSSPTWRTRRI